MTLSIQYKEASGLVKRVHTAPPKATEPPKVPTIPRNDDKPFVEVRSEAERSSAPSKPSTVASAQLRAAKAYGDVANLI